MKILLISAFPPPAGGIATWTVLYNKYCKKNNISLSITNIALKGKRGSHINNRRNIIDEIRRTYNILNNYRFKIKNFKPDIIHLNTSCSQFGIIRDYLCVIIANKKKIPIVLHCHCNTHKEVSNRISKALFKKMVNKADSVFVLNRDSERFIKKYTEKNTIWRIPNFIDESMVFNTREVASMIKEVLFVGHVQPMKGSDEIFSAAKQLKDIHFTLVGPIKKGLDVSQCPPNVTLIGQKDYSEVKEFYKKADIYLFPSYSEGFSMSLAEAMATGLPCIATPVGANCDMLENKGGRIIPVGNCNAIVKAIKSMSDPTLRQKMSNWNINKVKMEYSVDRVMNIIFNLYRNILKE